MLIFTSDQVRQALPYDQLIEALRKIFRTDYEMPVRHHHFYQTKEGIENTLILMPVWNAAYMGIKQVIVAPDNHRLQLPAIYAQYTLINSSTGQPLAMMDASELTSRRTACTSALAASYLARQDAKILCVIGGGKVAQHLIQAHTQVHSYERILVWMRNEQKLAAFIAEMQSSGFPVEAASSLEDGVRQADVISCATLSPTPLIKGDWVQAGAHLDLIGAHTPQTREADDEAVKKSLLFVDSPAATHETGELAIPLAKQLIQASDIQADLRALCLGQHPGRVHDQDITLFKSAGLAVEDLAAALLVYQQATEQTSASI